jgi:hypothetical protein
MSRTDWDDVFEHCPACDTSVSFNTSTVMNSVDVVLQVPLLLDRLMVEQHGMILQCPHCLKYYLVDEQIVLTDEEQEQCNEIWEEWSASRNQ